MDVIYTAAVVDGKGDFFLVNKTVQRVRLEEVLKAVVGMNGSWTLAEKRDFPYPTFPRFDPGTKFFGGNPDFNEVARELDILYNSPRIESEIEREEIRNGLEQASLSNPAPFLAALDLYSPRNPLTDLGDEGCFRGIHYLCTTLYPTKKNFSTMVSRLMDDPGAVPTTILSLHEHLAGLLDERTLIFMHRARNIRTALAAKNREDAIEEVFAAHSAQQERVWPLAYACIRADDFWIARIVPGEGMAKEPGYCGPQRSISDRVQAYLRDFHLPFQLINTH